MSVQDAFSNPLFRLGYGSQSPLEATEYPLTRMTDNYALLNSLYRDNWVVQNVVGIIPDDMTKKWFAPAGAVGPEHLKELERVQRVTALRERVNEGLRWGRLYGGAAGLIMIRGQEGMLGQPLELESIYPGTFQGLYILDRWQGVVPGMELVFEGGEPVPAYYSITDARGNTVAKVHHSRLVRFTGRDLPFLERVAELYWGESEVEALYNDVVKHDNVAANMAALTFRANVDTMEVQNLDQLFSVTSGEQQRRFWNVMQAQSVMKSNFGMQLVNRGDQIKNTQYTFTGLQEVYDSMCLDLSGASRIPVTKLFGRSPAGMNATGESDLRNYYDYVDTLREAKLRPILEKLLPVLAMSAWGAVPDGLDITFPPLWTPTAAEVAEIALKKAQAIRDTFQAGLFRADTAQRELKKLADETGMFDSISEEEIAANAGKTYQDVTALRDPLAGMGYGGEVSAPFESIAQDAAVMDYPGQPREKNGRFSEGKMLTEGIKSGKIPLLDRTVGRNQTVTAMGQDGSMERYKLAPGSKITDAYIFAGGPGQKPISVAHFLEGKTGIPASQWRKAQGHGVVLNAGAQKGAVLHWFEANGEMYSVKVVKWE
ncbi:phage-associated protein, HI1409 family [Clostridium sp. ATCC BAA-442]|nr:phage-associated protein, HI1409 family [Clostridium sp. ATCC BAA-442]